MLPPTYIYTYQTADQAMHLCKALVCVCWHTGHVVLMLPCLSLPILWLPPMGLKRDSPSPPAAVL